MVKAKRLASVAAVLGLAVVGVTATPHEAKAWWRGGWGVGVWVPPVVVAPPASMGRPRLPMSPPPPAYYPPGYYPVPRRIWIPPHWNGPYWVPRPLGLSRLVMLPNRGVMAQMLRR